MILETVNFLLQAKADYDSHKASKTKPVEPKDKRPEIQALHKHRAK